MPFIDFHYDAAASVTQNILLEAFILPAGINASGNFPFSLTDLQKLPGIQNRSACGFLKRCTQGKFPSGVSYFMPPSIQHSMGYIGANVELIHCILL